MRVRRTLAGLAAAAALAQAEDCALLAEGCGAGSSDQREALLIGFACLGAPQDVDRPSQELTAVFRIVPKVVEPGEEVRLDASGSLAPRRGRIASYAWEFGPTGTEPVPVAFDDATGPRVDVTLPPPRDGTALRRIGLRVTDTRGGTAEAFQILHYAGGSGPSTEFVAIPNPAIVGEPVRFAAAEGGSTFSWDFEGDGAFTAPSPDAFAFHTYATPGERRVHLRVTGADGRVFERSLAMDVRVAETAGADLSAVARAAARTAVVPRGRRFRARLRGASLALDLAAMTGRGPVGRVRDVPADGRLTVRGLPALRRARWVAGLELAADVRTRTVTLRGTALATLARERGQACVRLTVRHRAGRVPRGRLRVLGGTGAAARLAARARFRVLADSGALRMRGSVRTRTRPPRLPPPGCGRA